jgi:hypothetical protein
MHYIKINVKEFTTLPAYMVAAAARWEIPIPERETFFDFIHRGIIHMCRISLLSLALVAMLFYSCEKTTGPVEPSEGWAVIRLTPPPVGGTIVFDPPGVRSGNEYRFENGKTVTATAIAAEGCSFRSWTGGNVFPTTEQIQIRVTADTVTLLSAIFNRPPLGTSWTKQESGTSSGLVSVTGGNGLIVAVGNNGIILTSTDGVSWTPKTSGVNYCLNHVIWTGTRFVAAGDSSTILTSTNGITWTITNGPAAGNLESVVWNGRMLIATGGYMINSGNTQNTIFTSYDGTAWSRNNAGLGIWYTAVWTGYAFVAGGYDFNFSTVSDNSRFSLELSIDGNNWRHINCNVKQYTCFNSMIYHNGKIIGVGGSRRTNDRFASVYYSPDAREWNYIRPPTDSALNSIAWSGTHYIAVGKGGTIITADTSLSTWTTLTSGVDVDLYEVACTGTRMVAVGYGGTILTSDCQCDQETEIHPLVDSWRAISTVITDSEGNRQTVQYDSTLSRIFTFFADNRLMIITLNGSMEPQYLTGTWSLQGTGLTFNVSGETGEMGYPPVPGTYMISGNTLTWTMKMEQNGVTATLTEVMERN